MDFYKRIMEWSPEARDAALKARKNKHGKTGDPAMRADVEKLARRGQAGSSGSKGEIDATDPRLHPSDDDDDDDLPDLPPKPGVKLDKDRTPAEIAARKKKKASDDQVIAIGRQKRLNKDDDDDDASEARIVRKTKKNEKIGGKALPDGPPQYKQPDDEAEAELDAEDEGPMEDQDWIQKAVNPKHKGYCTPMTKDTCTPARKALAKRFKKAARKEKKSGGTGWEGKV
jgi:hypothetical protein